MQFNAKQMREEALPAQGRYHFTVLHTKERTTPNGNDMLILKMRLEQNNKSFIFFTNIVLTPKMFWQFEHFCKAIGMAEKIEEGNLMAQECDEKEGELEMDHRVNQKTGEIEAYIKDFIKPEILETQDSNFINDDIPSFD